MKKEFLQAVGDGVSTLLDLIKQSNVVRFRLNGLMKKHESNLGKILSKEEVYILSYALNLNRGCKLVSLAHEKDKRLLHVFDKLSHYTKHFYYDRYDIKCKSIEYLKNGKNFSILEFNGCGAEAHHVYGNANSIWQAFKILLHHWKVLFQIAEYNHHKGFARWTFKRGWDYLKKGMHTLSV